ncbi:ABC transporter permease, partial [Rhizobium ruizarguesonis]
MSAHRGAAPSDRRRLLIQEYGIFLAFLLLVVVLSFSNEFFLTGG